MKWILNSRKAFTFLAIFGFAFQITLAKLPITILTIATSPNNETYFEVGNSFCDFINANITDDSIKCIAKTTHGSVQNITLALRDETTIGVSQMDTLINHEKSKNLRVIATLYLEPVFILASQTSTATKFNDVLLQQKINIGPKTSGESQTAKELIKTKGWEKQDLLEFNRYELPSLLCHSQIDIAFLVSSLHSNYVYDITKKCNANILPLEDDFIAELVKKNEGFSSFTIPSNTYAGQNNSVRTVAMEAVLFASESTSEELVFKALKAIFKDFKQLENSSKMFNGKKIKSFFKEGKIPFHKGTIKFLKELEQR